MTTKFTSRTRWREKLEKPQEPKIVDVPPKMSRFGKGSMLIPTPRLVDDLIRTVPKGKLVTVSELRRKLAADFDAPCRVSADHRSFYSHCRGSCRRGSLVRSPEDYAILASN